MDKCITVGMLTLSESCNYRNQTDHSSGKFISSAVTTSALNCRESIDSNPRCMLVSSSEITNYMVLDNHASVKGKTRITCSVTLMQESHLIDTTSHAPTSRADTVYHTFHFGSKITRKNYSKLVNVVSPKVRTTLCNTQGH